MCALDIFLLTMAEFLYQGAEARVYTIDFVGKPAVLKERLSKSYRVVELDRKINKQRLLQEARCIVKCRRAGVFAPSIYQIDTERNRLIMERIPGKTFKDILRDTSPEDQGKDWDKKFIWHHLNVHSRSYTDLIVSKREYFTAVAKCIGAAIGKLHDAEIVHGDLTTSNLMVREMDGELSTEVALIDFGLGMMKPTLEDKAVDLYVLERAFVSTHPGSEYLVRSNEHVSFNAKAVWFMTDTMHVRLRLMLYWSLIVFPAARDHRRCKSSTK